MTGSNKINVFEAQHRISDNAESIQTWRQKHHGASRRLAGVDQMGQIRYSLRSINWIDKMHDPNQNTARSKVETVLLDVTLTPAGVSRFTSIPEINNKDDEIVKYDNNKKKKFWQYKSSY